MIKTLADTLGARVQVTDRDGKVIEDAGGSVELPRCAHDRADALREAAPDTLDITAHGLHVRLLALGSCRPRPVLLLARERPFTPGEMLALPSAAGLCALIHRLTEAAEQRRHRVRSEITLRQSVFQMLMTSQTSSARRTAHNLYPGVLDRPFVRVSLLTCGTDHRETVSQGIEQELGRPVLCVHCPAISHQLIVITPAADDQEAQDTCLEGALERVIARTPARCAGVSRARQTQDAAAAYSEAVQAHLAADRSRTRSRVWHYSGPAEVAECLGSGAHRWAADLLQPLGRIPANTAGDWRGTAQVALFFTATQSSEILGLHRNTVTNHLDRLGEALHLDLGDARGQAVLSTALQIRARYAATDPARRAPRTVSLESLLQAEPAREWARSFLAPLSEQPALRGLLATWVANGQNADRTAAAAGCHPKTVRRRLRSAEETLRRVLFSEQGASGLHDTIMALRIVGELPELPDPVAPMPFCS
ncbi:hypothetical protein BIV57_11300 [Mangrovactinospora gilvigrisea]|uniref:PucR C-terminal helix-turn-helix domain-containing protein n=2 Tax=Mangrovactinospora gilvigrisea TaxID=1428644 RepID=A0A1J7BFE0_9ACTN|nr:hypothetical protein BIV57_11300 [Mangrovactinospora gilvigrisea]